MKLNPFVPLELRKEKKKDQITESRSFSGKLKTMQKKKNPKKRESEDFRNKKIEP